MSDHTEAPDPLPEPANLRFLRRLVTILTATMIFGILGILALLVIRINQAGDPLSFNLPNDIATHSVSVTEDRFFVVGADGQLYIFDRDRVLQLTVPIN